MVDISVSIPLTIALYLYPPKNHLDIIVAQSAKNILALVCLLFIQNIIASDCIAQNKYDFLLHKTYAERIPLFDTTVFKKLIALDSSLFDKEITILKTLANNQNDDGLYIEACLAEWYYKDRHKAYAIPESIAILKELLKECQKREQPLYIILIRFELGGILFYKAHDYNNAFTQYIENYSEIIKIPSSEMPNKKSIVLHTGNVYYNFGDYLAAKKYLLLADTIKNNWRARVSIQCKNTLGLIYRNSQQYDSALYYFDQAIEIAKKNNEEIWVAIASGNIGITYYKQNRLSEAIPLLTLDINRCIDYGSFDNAINSIIMLADIYIQLNRPELAKKELDRGWQYVDSMTDKVKHLPGLYNVTAKLYAYNGNYKDALYYKDLSSFYRDSIANRDNILYLARVQNRIREELHFNEIEKLKVEKQLIRTTRNALLAGILLFGVITFLVINRQRLKNKNKQQSLLSAKELAESKFKNARIQLDGFTARIQEKNAIIEKSAYEIEKLQSTLTEAEKKQDNNAVLQQLYASTILTDEEWDEFKRLFEQVHTGYILRLKSKLPGLSPADIRFVVLSKLKLSNKEMASILGVQSDTIRTYKHRLRKKFEIDDEQSLSKIIDNI